MDENHPEIILDELNNKYASRLESLNKLAEASIFQSKRENNYIHCFLCGDILSCSYSPIGIQERMNEYIKGQDKVNDGYIQTVKGHEWTFSDENNGYVTMKYWFDPNSENKPFKIHLFNDKIVIERSSGSVHSIVVANKYWVHYAGEKKSK
jgi:hypothetical protein